MDVSSALTSAPTHAAKGTIDYLNEHKLNYITPEEWMPNSLDAAPMDYSIWSFLKNKLNSTEIKTIGQLKKRLLYEWRKMGQSLNDIALAAWPKQVDKIFQTRGFHIEHKLKL